MSILSRDTIQVVAGSIGINVSDEVAEGLIADIEYRVRDILNEAGKFMRHSKRQRLTSEDITNAFSVRNVEPPYGWSSDRNPRFIPSWKTPQTLYYLEDPRVSLESVINERLPPVPLDVTYTVHWLAVEGVQPAIAQNPIPSVLNIRKKIAEPSSNSNDSDKDHKRGLSKEVQFYYEKIVEAILGESEELKKLAFESVRQDSAIQYLTPYLVRFITEQVLKNMNNLKITNSMLRLIHAILTNSAVLVEAHLHQIIPNVLTCLVGKNLSKDPRGNHWSLRIYASKLVAHICKKYNTVYAILQTRVTKTLLHALLSTEKTYPTNYGAIVGLHALGPEVIRLFLIPSLFEFKSKLEKTLNDPSLDSSSPEVLGAEKCFEAVINALVSYYEFLIVKGDLNIEKDSDRMLSSIESEIRDKHPYFADKMIERLRCISKK